MCVHGDRRSPFLEFVKDQLRLDPEALEVGPSMARMPLDIDEIRAQKHQIDQEAKTPKFLGSAERREQKAALALARRALEVEQRLQALPGVNGSYQKDERDIAIDKVSDRPHNGYIGLDEAPRKKRKINDSRKFNFEWDGSDDTSVDHNPIYASKHNALLYGRGKIGGFTDQGRSLDYHKALTKIDPERASQLSTKTSAESQKRMWDDRHWTEKDLKDMRERDWRILKEDFSIQMKGGQLAQPLRSWKDAQFPEEISKAIQSVGYTEPTPIQRATIPIGLQCRDIMGIAETGSGKTASFVLPMLVYISSLPPINDRNKNDGPYAIVLAPTRELAQQIEIETRKFASVLGMTVVSMVGGHAIEEQSFNLRDGAEILIATPGRLLDCLDRHVLVLTQCTYLVMDEADRMVDLGFEEQLNQILDALPAHNMKPDSTDAEQPEKMSVLLGNQRYRQTVMFSATMPVSVEKLARKYLRRPATVIVGNAGQVVDTVEQRVELINGEEKKKRRLEEVLNSGEFDRPVIVFVNTKKNCDILSKHLSSIGWNAVILHGGKSQDQREASLAKLRSGEADALVATDLAGRGIDIRDVSLVINFNMSKTIEDYVHRIGRTGRAGKNGVALTFISDSDEELFYPLKLVLKNASNVPSAIRGATRVREIID